MIVVVPVVLPVANPLLVAIEAIPEDELQLTTLLMSCDVPSSNLPSAVNCCCVPTSMDAVAGVTMMESSVALVTVSVHVPETPLMLALIVAEPAATNAAARATTSTGTCRFRTLITDSRRSLATGAPEGAGTSQVVEASRGIGYPQPGNVRRNGLFRPWNLPQPTDGGPHKVGGNEVLCCGTVPPS